MSPSLRTRIDAIEPRQVSLTEAGRARIRVQGWALGFVGCAGQRRAVWGSFDETFQVACTGSALMVSAFGIGGRARTSIPFRAAEDIVPPEAPPLRHLRFLPFSLPGIKPLTNELLQAVARSASELTAPPKRSSTPAADPAAKPPLGSKQP